MPEFSCDIDVSVSCDPATVKEGQKFTITGAYTIHKKCVENAAIMYRTSFSWDNWQSSANSLWRSTPHPIEGLAYRGSAGETLKYKAEVKCNTCQFENSAEGEVVILPP